MTAVKEQAVEMINQLSDDKVIVIIRYLQNLANKQGDDGTLAYLFRNYVDDGIREPLTDFGDAVGNEKW
jgi:hypothetical protein